MIRRIRHKGLANLHRCDRTEGVAPGHLSRLRRILARLEKAKVPADMNLPGWRLHELRGTYAGFWSVSVNGSWRVIFRFENSEPTDIDYLDYH